ncbi:class I SAM-dependent methyltransferase [Evansella clarkii]|uniref:class I SAM-dependent methyltransferase n=1 Tax=Evansella clarkii TaxID=79879 RepID=UPI000996F4D7|nr:class I SAM-dependent methyltransferase [Evansella clarkii]
MDNYNLTNTELIFNTLDKGANVIQKEKDDTYLDALAEMGEVIFHEEIPSWLSETGRAQVSKALKELPEKGAAAKEEYRRAVQLAVLKGMKEATQPHHAMTPDAVSLFIGYLADKVLGYEENEEAKVILDPAVGAGNLLTAVMNQVKTKTHGAGAEADETLLRLSFINANLQEHSVDLFHQDSVASPLIKNVDMIVTDLPAGFYPNDAVASRYTLASKEGHSFVHHLLIEQAVNHVKPGGFMFFLVPNFIFESEEAKELHEYIKKEAIIYSFLQLPKSMFKNQKWGKSILVLRKQKDGIIPPKQALLAELPSFSNKQALADIMQRIAGWFDDHLK